MPACAIPEDLREAGIFTAKCDRFMIDIGPGYLAVFSPLAAELEAGAVRHDG